MRISLAIVVAAALASGGLLSALYGIGGGLQTAALLAAVGTGGLAVAHVASRRRRALRLRLRGLFAVAVGLAVGSILVATIVGALLMFVSGHDAVIVSVVTVFAGLLAARAAGLIASEVLSDVQHIEHGLMAIGEGRREVTLALDGPDELAHLGREAEQMVTRLLAEETRARASESARRDLVAAASHDLRTPLSALRLLVDAIDDDLVDEATRRRYVRTMQTHLGALTSLVDDLFELSRMQAGDMAWALRQISLCELLDETVQALGPSAQERGVALQAELPDPALMARADPEKLQRVLFNLVHNAIRHTPADGSVTIHVSPLPDETVIEVADTGIGIDPAEHGRVFEPFYRSGQDVSRSSDGAGLGLAISRAIVEGHGGRIWIEPAQRGTRVRFSLPAPEPVALGR